MVQSEDPQQLASAPAEQSTSVAPRPASSAVHRYRAVRQATEALTRALTPEDQLAQSMPDASPTKWHLAHVTWFWETFLLIPNLAGYKPFDPRFHYLFNSYYEALGPRQPRPQRGLLTRPSLNDVIAYRAHVDAAMSRLLSDGAGGLAPLVDLGLAHEEQHQELILMDILHLFAQSPLQPAYAPPRHTSLGQPPEALRDLRGQVERLAFPVARQVLAALHDRAVLVDQAGAADPHERGELHLLVVGALPLDGGSASPARVLALIG